VWIKAVCNLPTPGGLSSWVLDKASLSLGRMLFPSPSWAEKLI
jgi:hypothetical protein